MKASRTLSLALALLPLGGCALILGNDGDFSLASDAATGTSDGAVGDGSSDGSRDTGAVDSGYCAADTVPCGQRATCLPPGSTGKFCQGLTCANGSCVDCRPESTICGEALPDGCGNGSSRGTKCTSGTTCCTTGSNRGNCRSGC
jgi:hypothetical protein